MLDSIDRYEKYRSESLDKILLDVKRGAIKSGRYANKVKCKTKLDLKKEFIYERSKDNTK